mmetsp:Transcript_2794/g.6629  ORF Transcript_2794/g.6629 Transcript_2794/m.6629 type:complete len:243 (-) Transcript_2794:1072-1800(-)
MQLGRGEDRRLPGARRLPGLHGAGLGGGGPRAVGGLAGQGAVACGPGAEGLGLLGRAGCYAAGTNLHSFGNDWWNCTRLSNENVLLAPILRMLQQRADQPVQRPVLACWKDRMTIVPVQIQNGDCQSLTNLRPVRHVIQHRSLALEQRPRQVHPGRLRQIRRHSPPRGIVHLHGHRVVQPSGRVDGHAPGSLLGHAGVVLVRGVHAGRGEAAVVQVEVGGVEGHHTGKSYIPSVRLSSQAIT